MTEGEKIKASDGIGSKLLFTKEALTTSMDSEDNPAALIEVIPDGGPADASKTPATPLANGPSPPG